jgi:hypothetical protein
MGAREYGFSQTAQALEKQPRIPQLRHAANGGDEAL